VWAGPTVGHVSEPVWAKVAWALAALLLLAAAWRLLTPESGAGAAPAVRIERGGVPGGGDGEGGGRAVAYVHVAGAVREPGLYRVPPSARIAVALERAGGPTARADLTAVNLAATVEDGQQILVPRRGAALAASGASAAGGSGAAPPGLGTPGSPGVPQISLATATLEQLDTLDGIGPTLAQRILEYRQAHGGFRSVEELREVEGIGEKRFASLREAVRP
jgi:competence protein ComEA